ncbi:hypothetical protein NXM83_003706 [Salmonella enterica subsp. enterica serovar Urbana]|nr:hypothetical protein [Salmonella enterica subsp. enterica serovar Sundsvall]EAW1311179.1 hypothetical protein [Salmonella enterica subsp. enterica]EGG9255189.1 hypothetical protein [Salmonella enterica]EJR6478676.1 hypothetical protein [Salmonella enterica subsp. enterica serovar Urbana]EBP9903575.1 hypothetical protein [Salmonella enterica subsp. enterica]
MAELLTKEDIIALVQNGLEIYKEKEFLEAYGIFMGKAQLLEFGLKKVLLSMPGVTITSDKLEKYTLGRTRAALEDNNLRSDYIHLLKIFVEKRNNMAHDFLADFALTQHILQQTGLQHIFMGDLFRAAYELEQLIVLFDYINEANDITAWLEPEAQ